MIAYSLLFFFFFRLINDFVAAIYAFGLLGTSIPPEIAAVLFLFSPALLIFIRRAPSRKNLILLGVLVVLAGAVEAMLDTRGRMLVSGIGAGSFLVFLPCLLATMGQKRNASNAPALGAGLALGLALVMLFRAWNSGVDPSTQWIGHVSGWILAAAAGLLLPPELKRTVTGPDRLKDPAHPLSFIRTAGLSLGILSTLTMLTFAFVGPNVIARWTGADYNLIYGLAILSLCLFAILYPFLASGRAGISLGGAILWNALFVAFLVLAILPHQLKFPVDPGSYPFYDPPADRLDQIPLILMIVLFPVILLDFTLYCRELIAMQPGIRRLGCGFSLGSFFLLLMILAQVFTTVYDYVPIVGPLLRDRFWLVFLILGLGLALPGLLVHFDHPARKFSLPSTFTVGLIGIGVAGFAGVLLTSAKPAAPPSGKNSLRIFTYNIQQGYSADGQKSYVEQTELMRQVDADVIGLQETDANRIAGGNSDLVRFFADQLNLFSYYGPKVVPGTFGIALLSKYPIENPRTFYLYSQGEQTAAITAQITVDGRTFHVFVTHLGNSGPLVQQEALLQELAGKQDVIAMGDFNFSPETEQYRKTVALLKDAWLLKWPKGRDDQGNNPADRIDHIFLSPGIEVKEARYLFGPQSDHPALLVDVQP